MSQVLANVPDVTTFAANVVVFLTAITAAVVGSLSAVKKIKESWLESNKGEPAKITAMVAGTSIMESTTLLMWSESNRNVCEALDDMTKELRELRHELELDRISRDARK